MTKWKQVKKHCSTTYCLKCNYLGQPCTVDMRIKYGPAEDWSDKKHPTEGELEFF